MIPQSQLNPVPAAGKPWQGRVRLQRSCPHGPGPSMNGERLIEVTVRDARDPAGTPRQQSR